MSAHTAEQIISIVTVEAADRSAAVAVALAVVSEALNLSREMGAVHGISLSFACKGRPRAATSGPGRQPKSARASQRGISRSVMRCAGQLSSFPLHGSEAVDKSSQPPCPGR
jgi:hypothetical protein